LPYALFATKEQLRRSYPFFADFEELKHTLDQNNIFQNSLWQRYGVE